MFNCCCCFPEKETGDYTPLFDSRQPIQVSLTPHPHKIQQVVQNTPLTVNKQLGSLDNLAIQMPTTKESSTVKTQKIVSQLSTIQSTVTTTPSNNKFPQKSKDLVQEDSTSQILVLEGRTLTEQGRHEEALACYQKALKIRLEAFGENHPQSLPYEITCYKMIMESLCKLKQISEAIVFGKKTIDAQLCLYGENHAEVAKSVNSIGMLFFLERQFQNALDYFQRADRIQSVIYGVKHPYIADNYKYIGMTLNKLKNFDGALEFLKKSLEMRIELHGEHHMVTKETYQAFVDLYTDFHMFDRAAECYKKILQCYIEKYGEFHFETAKTCALIGQFLQQHKEIEEGQKYLQKSIAILDQLEAKK